MRAHKHTSAPLPATYLANIFASSRFSKRPPVQLGACYLACHYNSVEFSKTKRGVPTGLPLPLFTYSLPVSHSSQPEHTQHSTPCFNINWWDPRCTAPLHQTASNATGTDPAADPSCYWLTCFEYVQVGILVLSLGFSCFSFTFSHLWTVLKLRDAAGGNG